ncbi:uncharacterized protein LOC141911298 [Tubulanus polymorphus]|uniref:uncharacterized protein LOC141911298 n=1 Tax=Tubulanus polymorphus TaxID=672921 RepID=UPI003DA2C352
MAEAEDFVEQAEERLLIMECWRKKLTKQPKEETISAVAQPISASVTQNLPPTDSDDNTNENHAPPAPPQTTNQRGTNLPKLVLPNFDGNVLNWITFIDAFNSAVDQNNSISPIQKFQYLQCQLHGEALKTIEGLSLTNNNYGHAMDLLKERYGQKQKITNAYMSALLELKQPRYEVDSLRNFYDTIESHVRGLQALGTSEESYGSLLIPMIMNKLPLEVRTQIARNQPPKCQSKKHHTLLHEVFNNPRETDRKTESHQSILTERNTNIRTAGPVLLKTAVADVAHRNDDHFEQAFILFDEGSTKTFITRDMADKLCLKIDSSEDINLAVFGDTAPCSRLFDQVTVKLKTKNGSILDLKALVTDAISSPMQTYSYNLKNLDYLNGLQLAHPLTYTDYSYDLSILIGADYYWQLVENETVRGNGPTAVASKLGYLLSGPIVGQTKHNLQRAMFVKTDYRRESDELNKFWDIETLGIKSSENNTEKTITFDDYRENYLTKSENSYIANQINLVLQYTYKYFTKRVISETRYVYNRIIEDQLSRDFIERVHDDDETRGHYLPHHSVKKDSKTTPIRIVYDCSCRQSGVDPSINDCLETGPRLLNDLAAILLQQRTGHVALSSDIEKAFLMVKLDTRDREYTKFFWLCDPSDPDSDFIVYRFKSVLFGAACSPFILNAVVKLHLEQYDSPVASDLKAKIYLDNVITSVENESEALDYYRESVKIMSDGGFDLCEWTSNSTALRELAETNNTLNRNEEVSNLGMIWNITDDTLKYKQGQKPANIATKREVVKSVSNLYDPLGYLSPVHVSSKIFIQQLWLNDLKWDELLNDELEMQWRVLETDLHRVRREIEIDRQFSPKMTFRGRCERKFETMDRRYFEMNFIVLSCYKLFAYVYTTISRYKTFCVFMFTFTLTFVVTPRACVLNDCLL